MTSSSTFDDSVTIFPAIGNGNFGPYARFDVDETPFGIASGDLNGDGYQDMVTSNGLYEGNQGSFSVLLRSGTTAISAALQDASVRDGVVRLRWIVPSSSTQAAVYRRTSETGWQYLGQASDDPGGFVSYEDPTVEPGARYAYRIHVQDQGEQGYSSEVWIQCQETRGPLWRSGSIRSSRTPWNAKHGSTLSFRDQEGSVLRSSA